MAVVVVIKEARSAVATAGEVVKMAGEDLAMARGVTMAGQVEATAGEDLAVPKVVATQGEVAVMVVVA